MGDSREYVQGAGQGTDTRTSPSDPPSDPSTWDRTYGHILRAAAGTNMPGSTTVMDTCTVTGPGSWYKIDVSPMVSQQGDTITPINNHIVDTNIHGFVNIGANAKGTIVRNVKFSGSARKIVQVGSGSDLVMEKICAPAGATVEGQGTVLFEGTRVALPFTISSAAQCTSW